MSVSGFKDELLKRFDEAFEKEANAAFGALRMFDFNRAAMITGRSDGLHNAAEIVRDVYKMFVDSDEGDADDAKPLY